MSDQISLRYLQKLVTVLRNIVPTLTGQPSGNKTILFCYYYLISFCMILIYTAVSPGIVNSMTASPTESARTKSRSASPDENVIISTTAASLPVASSSNTRTKKKRGRRGTTSKRERVE